MSFLPPKGWSAFLSCWWEHADQNVSIIYMYKRSTERCSFKIRNDKINCIQSLTHAPNHCLRERLFVNSEFSINTKTSYCIIPCNSGAFWNVYITDIWLVRGQRHCWDARQIRGKLRPWDMADIWNDSLRCIFMNGNYRLRFSWNL